MLKSLLSKALLFILLSFASDLRAQPANDNIVDALEITQIPYSGSASNVDATAEPGEPVASCAFSDIPNSVWWKFTPTESDTYVLTGEGLTAVHLSIWSGEPSSLSEVSCRRLNGGSTRDWWEAEAGTTYYIRVAGTFETYVGDISLFLDKAPIGDDFDDRFVFTGPSFSDVQSNVNATSEPDEPVASCGFSEVPNSIWWEFTPTESETYVLSADGLTRVHISIWAGDPAALTEVACRAVTGRTRTWWEAEAGTTYYIRAAGAFESYQGDIEISVVQATAGDDFDDRFVFTGTSFSDVQSNVNATSEPDEPVASCGNAEVPNSIWWEFTPTESETYVLSADGLTRVHISIWAGDPAALTEVACRAVTGRTRTWWEAETGTTYYIRAAGAFETYEGDIEISVVQTTAGDDIAEAFVFTGTSFADVQSNINSTVEPGEPIPSCEDRETFNSIWWQFTPTESATYVATGDDITVPVVSIWTGDPTALTEVACRDVAGRSRAWWEAEAGTTYYIKVAGSFETYEGDISLVVDQAAEGDDIAEAFVFTGTSFVDVQSNINATVEPGEPIPSCEDRETFNSIWWQFTPTESATYVATGDDITVPVVSIWSGDPTALTEVACRDVPGRSRAWWEAEAGTTYYIKVAGSFETYEGDISLVVDQAAEGDDIAEAFVFTGTSFADVQSNINATVEPGEPIPSCEDRETFNSIWWQFTPTESATYVATGDDITVPVVSVWTGDPAALTEVACRDVPGRSRAWWEAEAGTTYYIKVAGEFETYEGDISLVVDQAAEGDDIAEAFVFTGTSFVDVQSNINATVEPGEPIPSCEDRETFNSIWWQFTPTESATYVATGDDITVPVVSIWSGDPAAFTEVACRAEPGRSRAWWEAEAGTVYYIKIAGSFETYEGNITLTVNPAPVGDDLNEATLISALPFNDNNTTQNATLEDNEIEADCDGGENSIWWQFTPTQAETYTATFPENNAGHISIWTGQNHPLTEVACDRDFTLPSVDWAGEAGTTYWIRIAGTSDTDEEVKSLLVRTSSGIVRPANDNLASAIPITALPFEDTQTSLNGTTEPGEVSPSCGDNENSVWWQFTAPTTTSYVISSVGTAAQSAISIWQGEAHPLTELQCATASNLLLEATAGTNYFIQIANQVSGTDGNTVRLSVMESSISVTSTVEDPAVNANDLVIQATFTGAFTPTRSDLFYKRTLDSLYQQTGMASQGGNVYTGVIPGSFVSELGVDYYVEFSDGTNTFTFPPVEPIDSPVRVPVGVLQRSAQVVISPDNYTMTSVPLNLQDASITAVLEDDYGPFNGEDWLLYRWNAATESYDVYPDISTDFSRGQSYWLITTADAPFDIENGTSPDLTGSTTLTLAPGWNQIANPYTFPIRWDQGSLPPAIGLPVEWISEVAGYAYDIEALEPWKGYFVFNSGTASEDVTLAPVSAPIVLSKTSTAWYEREGYILRATATHEDGNLVDAENYFGLSLQDSTGYLVPEAPGIGRHVRLSLIREDQRLAGDFQPFSPEGQWWDLDIAVEEPDDLFATTAQITIHLQEMGQQPDGLELYVLDQDNGRPIALREQRFSVEVGGAFETRRLRVILGTEAYAIANSEGTPLEPVAFALEPNYPNPFTAETYIGYQLAETEHVRIEVFNVLGQRIASLVDETRDAGVYTAQWNGRDASGRYAPSGLYFYRMQAGPHTLNRSMILRR